MKERIQKMLNFNNEWTEIETPYLDRHNDYLSIYVKQKQNHFELTDGGYIISDLKTSGCPFNKVQYATLKQILADFGIQLKENDMMCTEAYTENFPVKKHNLIKAMLSVNDLFA